MRRGWSDWSRRAIVGGRLFEALPLYGRGRLCASVLSRCLRTVLTARRLRVERYPFIPPMLVGRPASMDRRAAILPRRTSVGPAGRSLLKVAPAGRASSLASLAAVCVRLPAATATAETWPLPAVGTWRGARGLDPTGGPRPRDRFAGWFDGISIEIGRASCRERVYTKV